MAKLLLSNTSGLFSGDTIQRFPSLQIEFENIMLNSSTILPDYVTLFYPAYSRAYSFDIKNVNYMLERLLQIIEIEKVSEIKIRELKIFDSAYDKMKQANLSFRNDDYPSTFNNLNTALELVLKDKLSIPVTITNINTAKIIDILVSNKIGFYVYLKEIQNKLLAIDNKVKHQGYIPSKIECINAIGAMEGLISKSRDQKIDLKEDIKKKIYEEL